MSRSAELWAIGATSSTRACLVGAGTVDVVLGLDDMTALRQAVEVVVGRAVLWCAVVTPVVAAQLIYGLHAGSTFVDNLYEVVVAVGLDGQAYFYSVADFTLNIGCLL